MLSIESDAFDEGYLKDLGRAALTLEDRFAITGQETCDGVISIVVTNTHNTNSTSSDKFTVNFPCKLNDQNLSSLISEASPAAFGHGKETCVDTTVREAKDLRADRFEINGFSPEYLLGIIRDALVPDADSITAELHKLNIYSKGGHFQSHKDTPRGDGFFGTLVIVLPVLHIGGILQIDAPNESSSSSSDLTISSITVDAGDEMLGSSYSDLRGCWHEYSGKSSRPVFRSGLLSTMNKTSVEGKVEADAKKAQAKKKLLDTLPQPSLRWAAFFGDCNHKVIDVEFGNRVTISYILRRSDGKCNEIAGQSLTTSLSDTTAALTSSSTTSSTTATSTSTQSANEQLQIMTFRAKRFTEHFVHALQKPDFYPTGGTIGFACIHLYEDRELPAAGSVVPQYSRECIATERCRCLGMCLCSSFGTRCTSTTTCQ